MRFNTNGTHQASLYSLPPSGKRVGVPVVSIMKFTGGQWRESWTFADELGLMLQLGAPNLVHG
jgi:predicted ester cyclase